LKGSRELNHAGNSEVKPEPGEEFAESSLVDD
jgi:hypothetical protein